MNQQESFPDPESAEKDVPTAGSLIKLAVRDNVFILLVVLSCIITGLGIWVAAGDPHGKQGWSMPAAILAPALPVAWSIVQLLWNDTKPELFIGSAFLRSVAVPFFSVVPTLFFAVVTVLLPVVNRTIEETRYGEYGTHYYFSVRDGSPLQVVIAGTGVLGYAAGVLAGLLIIVFVLLPTMAFGNPKKFAQVNQLEPGEEHAKSNAVASKALSVFLMLTFLIPTLIVFGKEHARGYTLGEAIKYTFSVFSYPYPSELVGDIAWTTGAVLIPIGVVAVVVAKFFQKPKAHRPAFPTLEGDIQAESLNESPANRTRNEK
ncbi:hypothetical protein V5R04_08785 [Jonesiaceae bacterium BS-20]|uniref:Uncharacterized protein n=1 Tax=Jonesiaceae bacterium BS-20 TaxID=3120821 RepID=A0AAU7DRB3_9MICO